MIQWHDYLEVLIGIIVVVDPLGIIPIFISVTGDETEQERSRTARVAALATGAFLIVATFIGQPVLRLFGISIASFRVAGGILIMFMAISMMNARVSSAKHTPEEAREAEAKQNVAMVPLAVPLLAGPAAFSTVIIYAHESPGITFKGFLIVSIVIVSFLVWISLRLSIPLSRKLGKTGLNNATRLMGLLLAAIAVEFIATGLLELFPGLAARPS